MKSLALSVDHPDYLMLFKMHVSRNAAARGRAVCEGVGLDAPAIDKCFSNNPHDVEEAVQEGLIKWSGGNSTQPPTWRVLLDAMEYAKIPQPYIDDLEEILGMLFAIVCSVCLHMWMCVVHVFVCVRVCANMYGYTLHMCCLTVMYVFTCVYMLCKMTNGRESPSSVDACTNTPVRL